MPEPRAGDNSIGKMSSPEKDQGKRRRKESKRRDANAIERRRIQEFNEVMRRLREVTKHISIDNKKKGRKVTKLTTIRAAIKHIKGLEHLLEISENNPENNSFVMHKAFQDITKHQNNLINEKTTKDNPTKGANLPWSQANALHPEQLAPKCEPTSELSCDLDMSLTNMYADTIGHGEDMDSIDIKVENNDVTIAESEEELVGEVYDQDYLLVDDNGEFKIVTIEQRFALPHLLYLEGWRSGLGWEENGDLATPETV